VSGRVEVAPFLVVGRIAVPGRRHGQAQPSRVVVVAVHHGGHRPLRGGAGGGAVRWVRWTCSTPTRVRRLRTRRLPSGSRRPRRGRRVLAAGRAWAQPRREVVERGADRLSGCWCTAEGWQVAVEVLEGSTAESEILKFLDTFLHARFAVIPYPLVLGKPVFGVAKVLPESTMASN